MWDTGTAVSKPLWIFWGCFSLDRKLRGKAGATQYGAAGLLWHVASCGIVNIVNVNIVKCGMWHVDSCGLWQILLEFFIIWLNITQ